MHKIKYKLLSIYLVNIFRRTYYLLNFNEYIKVVLFDIRHEQKHLIIEYLASSIKIMLNEDF